MSPLRSSCSVSFSQPDTFGQSLDIAREGGNVAGDTRKNIEQRIGQTGISPLNANDKPSLEVNEADASELDNKEND